MPVGPRRVLGLIASLGLGLSPTAIAAPGPSARNAKPVAPAAAAPVPPTTLATPAPAVAKKPAGGRRAARSKPETPKAPALPPVAPKLEILDAGPDERWKLKITNTSSGVVSVADELRLLWLEVALPGQAKPKVCRLPDELVPKVPNEDDVEDLDPGESIEHSFDPRFYCFSPDKQEVLVPTAQVTPHYGWPSKTKRVWRRGHMEEGTLPDVAPFVAEPDDARAEGPAKNLTGNPVILDARYAAWAMDPANPNEDEGDEPALEMVRGSDAKSELSVVATLRVRNPSTSKLTVFMRRELVTFEVLTPRGTMNCVSGPDTRNPDRRAYVTLLPHASMKLVSRLVELCPRGTFAQSGLYLIHARFDADATADGSDFDIDAFTGSLHTPRPVAVRVRHTIRLEPNHGGPQTGGALAAMNGQPALGAPPPPVPLPPPLPPPPPPPPPPDQAP